jgi:hypothetical protein
LRLIGRDTQTECSLRHERVNIFLIYISFLWTNKYNCFLFILESKNCRFRLEASRERTWAIQGSTIYLCKYFQQEQKKWPKMLITNSISIMEIS